MTVACGYAPHSNGGTSLDESDVGYPGPARDSSAWSWGCPASNGANPWLIGRLISACAVRRRTELRRADPPRSDRHRRDLHLDADGAGEPGQRARWPCSWYRYTSIAPVTLTGSGPHSRRQSGLRRPVVRAIPGRTVRWSWTSWPLCRCRRSVRCSDRYQRSRSPDRSRHFEGGDRRQFRCGRRGRRRVGGLPRHRSSWMGSC